ncbi:uncharacterized protein LOC103700361 isoform X2 [Phoenix dactylifera]|uniref:Uncharacterized protein LOC103700361 isoform X2 n=1 Tax=Phoenix dactylifera TaxID=42345 RepID=A0A8B7BL30_PHODC|nr:uncharacterized protein LOC103700361 isoform X2 [Phoenix dactylifera]
MRRRKATTGRRTAASPGRERPLDSLGLEPVPSSSSAASRRSSRVSASLLFDGHAGFPAEEAGPDFTSELQDGGRWSSLAEPRTFPHSVKQQCWDKAEKVKGRDPDRWRRDPLGNVVFRKLVGCPGCLCHDYDHVLPYSKGGKSTLENCQVLQATVNRSKGNKTEISKSDLIQKSAYCRVSASNNHRTRYGSYRTLRIW